MGILAPLDRAHRDLYFDIKNSYSPKIPLTPLWLQALDIVALTWVEYK